MKCKGFVIALSIWGGMACAQPTPETRSPALSAQEKKTLAEIVSLQHKIEQSECEAAKSQDRLAILLHNASVPVQASLSAIDAKPAVILNINGEMFIVNAGVKNNGLRKGDELLVVERAGNTLRMTGTGVVDRAYDLDAECHAVQNYGIRPEAEVYVTNRCGSPHYLTRLRFLLAGK